MAVNLLTILKTTGIPVAYNRFKVVQASPFIVYTLVDTDNFAADGMVYAKRENYVIELYSSNRDTVSEGKIETALNTNEIFWDRTETYIPSEQLTLVAYDVQI